MNIRIRNKTKHREYDGYFSLLEKYGRKALRHAGKKGDYLISLTLVGPRSIRRINRDYRGIDKETDVISFAIQEGEAFCFPGEATDLGDIFINVKRVGTQARDYEHSEKREFIFLFVHGLLHCLGFDHMTPEDEKVMFDLQKRILGKLK